LKPTRMPALTGISSKVVVKLELTPRPATRVRHWWFQQRPCCFTSADRLARAEVKNFATW
jgi:hypothetical protein